MPKKESTTTKQKRVLVSGDVVVDHHIYSGERPKPDVSGRGTVAHLSWGGAKLAEGILKHLVDEMPAVHRGRVESENALRKRTLEKLEKAENEDGSKGRVVEPGSAAAALWQVAPEPGETIALDFGLKLGADRPCCPHKDNAPDELCPHGTDSLHAYALWEPREMGGESKWRCVQELGYGSAKKEPFDFTPFRKDPAKNPDVLLMDDAAVGFRWEFGKKEPKAHAWPECLDKGTLDGNARIILKMSRPLTRGKLWETLTRDPVNDKGDVIGKNPNREKLIVVVPSGEIRRAPVRVRTAISWEQTVGGLIRELLENPEVQGLLKCRHLIVPFRSEGALWVRDAYDKKKRSWWLILDPAHQEGEWPDTTSEGTVLGYMSCLTASLAAYLATPRVRWESSEDKKNDKRKIKVTFQERVETEEQTIELAIKRGLLAMRKLHQLGHGDVGTDPAYPTPALAKVIAADGGDVYQRIEVPGEVVTDADTRMKWRILAPPGRDSHQSAAEIMGIAHRVALFGIPELQEVPYGRYEGYVTADRDEIEAMQGLRQTIAQYLADRSIERPLSIAVFGAPGAGKSFAVKQLARVILGEKPDAPTFNLSQFEDEKDLVDALHQVRDLAIKGSLPLVFWDEYDTEDLRWLKSFLAPMQDGEFVDGPITHPIGRCIFVFAGGCYSSMAKFLEMDEDTFTEKKCRDFLSRLSGYLDIRGPNPPKGLTPDEVIKVDPCYPVRRALLIRGMRRMKDGDFLDIDPDLLRAILGTTEYRSGTRSLEKLLNMLAASSKLVGSSKGRLCQSALPPRATLDMFVDAEDFTTRLDQARSFTACADKIAPWIHAAYQGVAKKEEGGSRWADEFALLAEDKRHDNIAAARRIVDHLALIGYTVVPKASKRRKKDVTALLEKNLERLAKAEHDGWMLEKKRDGYDYDEFRDDDNRKHSSLKPYNQLSEADKEKDRNSIKDIPEHVKNSEHIVVPIQTPNTPGAARSKPQSKSKPKSKPKAKAGATKSKTGGGSRKKSRKTSR